MILVQLLLLLYIRLPAYCGDTVEEVKQIVDSLRHKANVAEVKKWLAPADPSMNIHAARGLRHPGTGDWLVESHKFQQWLHRPLHRYLWLHGLVGCGKTVLSTRILDHLEGRAVLRFFFDFRDLGKQTTNHMLRALVFQAYGYHLQRGRDFRDAMDFFESRESNAVLQGLLQKMLVDIEDITILLDALDESTTRETLVKWIRDFIDTPELGHVRLIFTSRPEPEFQEDIPEIINDANCMALDEAAINKDIQSYVKGTILGRKSLRRKLPKDGVLARQIYDKVGVKAGPM